MAKPTKKNQVAPLATTSKWSTNRWYHVIVFLFSFLLYVNSISNDYNLDDELVTRNHRLTSKGISAIPEIFSSPYYQDASGYSYEYRPIVLASFAIEHSLFGESAFVSHFINVLLYALVCLLLFVVLKKLLSTYPAIVPFAITILFAAHTAHTEVVCSIKNRDELLGLGFGLLALLSVRYALNKNKLAGFFITLVLYCFALLSKSTYVSFAVLIPISALLFFSIKLTDFVILITILLIPTYLFLIGLSGIDKIELLLLILISELIIYTIVHYLQVIPWALKLINNIQSVFSSTQPLVTDSDISTDNKSLHSFLPSKRELSPKYLIINISLGLWYLLAIQQSFIMFAILPLALLFLIAWFAKKEMAWSATSMLILCCTLNLVFVYQPTSLNTFGYRYYNIINIALAFILLRKDKSFAIPSVIGLLILLLNYKTFSPAEIGMGLVFAYLLQYKVIQILGGILNLTSIGYSLLLEANFNVWHQLIPLILILGIAFKKTSLAIWTILIIALIFFHVSNPKHDSSFLQSSKKTFANGYNFVSKTAEQANVTIIKQSENRPVHYVENCISFTDDLSSRIGTSLEVAMHYAAKTILPYPLSFYYGFKIIYPQKLYAPIAIIGLLIYGLLLLVCFLLAKKQPLISLGLFVYLVAMAVFSNFLIRIPGMVGDRYLLVPSLGWSMAIVGVLYWLMRKNNSTFPETYMQIQPAYKYSFLVLLILYSALTLARNRDWEDDLTLFRKDISYVSESAQAHNLLALHLMMHSEVETNPTTAMAMTQEALVHFKKAKQIYPKFFNASYDIGRVYIKLNMIDSALIAFKDATTIDSTYATLYNYIGEIYFSKQMYNEAVPYYEKVVELDPLNYDNYNKLSYDYFMLKKYDKSVEVCKKALAAIPSEPQPLINMGRMFLLQNKTDSALYYLNIAKTKVPNNPELNSLLQQVKQ